MARNAVIEKTRNRQLENPNCWGQVRLAIDEAIREFHRQQKAGEFGYSDVTIIYNTLRKYGLCIEDVQTERPQFATLNYDANGSPIVD